MRAIRPIHGRDARATSGITLVELLTAMMVSTLLIGTAFATFWTATNAWEKAKRRTEMLRLLEGAAAIVERHIRAVQAPFLEINATFVAVSDGDDYGDYDGVCFLSGANARFPRQLAMADLCEVEFYIETGQRGVYEDEQPTMDGSAGGLWMRIDPTPDDDVEAGGYLLSLGEQIVSFDLRFFDGYEWVDEWFYDYEVPEAIEFTLIVTDPEDRENPMSLSRLVTIAQARRINDQTTGESSTMTAEAGPEPESPEATSESSEGGPGGPSGPGEP